MIKSHVSFTRESIGSIAMLFGLIICVLVFVVLASKFSYFISIATMCFAISLILIQYFDMEYRWAIGIALFLLTTCPFLLIGKLENIAEIYANYTYGYLVFGLIFVLFDKLREKAKQTGRFAIYRKLMFSLIFVVVLLFNYLIFYQVFTSYRYIQPFRIYTELMKPKVYKWLKSQPGYFAVVEYPLLDEKGGVPQNYMEFQKIYGNRFFNILLENEENLMQKFLDLGSPDVARILGNLGVKYIIVNKNKPGFSFPQEAMERASWLALSYSDHDVEVFNIQSNWINPPVYKVSDVVYVSSVRALPILEALESKNISGGVNQSMFYHIGTGSFNNNAQIMNLASQIVVSIDTSADTADDAGRKYRVCYAGTASIPSIMVTKETYHFPIYMFNAGSKTWPQKSEGNNVNISYHWLNAQNGEVVLYDGVRTRFAYTVLPGELVQVEVEIKTPSVPGNYILQIDLVKEQEFWFSQKGMDPLSKEVKVVAQGQAEGTDLYETDWSEAPNKILRQIFTERPELVGENFPVSFSFYIPEAGEYTFYALKQSLPATIGTKYRLDDSEWLVSGVELVDSTMQPDPQDEENRAEYLLRLFEMKLDKGVHRLTLYDNSIFLNENRQKDCEVIVAHYLKQGTTFRVNKNPGKNEIFVERINPDQYRISIDSSEPMFLAVNEILFPANEALYEDGQKIELFQSDGYNLLRLDRIGKYDIVIRVPQQQSEKPDSNIYIFWAISIVSLGFVILPWIKHRYYGGHHAKPDNSK